MAQLLGTAMEIDPTVRADIDIDAAFRDAYDGTGAPAGWLVDKDRANAVKAQVRAQQGAAQRAADLGHLGEQASKMATAAKNVGEASTALENAGLV
jgi:hypothetical protein